MTGLGRLGGALAGAILLVGLAHGQAVTPSDPYFVSRGAWGQAGPRGRAPVWGRGPELD